MAMSQAQIQPLEQIFMERKKTKFQVVNIWEKKEE